MCLLFLDEGKKWLSDNWKLCDPLKTAEHVKILKDYLQEIYIDLAMANYPYASSFLAPLPGNPVKVSILAVNLFSGTDFLIN